MDAVQFSFSDDVILIFHTENLEDAKAINFIVNLNILGAIIIYIKHLFLLFFFDLLQYTPYLSLKLHTSIYWCPLNSHDHEAAAL